MSTVSNIIAATELSIGRNPSITWINDPDEFLYSPGLGTNGTNTGISVVNAVSAYLMISMRHAAGQKSAYMTITRSLWGSSYSYAFWVNGTTYTTTGQASAEATVDVLAAAINAAASATTDPRAVAIASDTSGTIDTLYVYALDVAATGAASALRVNATTTNSATGAIKGYVDPTACKARVWGKIARPSTLPIDTPWLLIQNGDIGAVTVRGFMERLNVAGFERIYVEMYDITKSGDDDAGVTARPFLAIAPAIAEV